ncbi:MAG TPA: cyclase family protein [Thermomicrobiales bacterium]|nr:cyclase family protein [Thermomicrobiales bacterium]
MSTAATDLLRDFEALFARTEVVDLSAVLEEGAPIWPTHPPLIIHRTVTHERHGYFTNSIFMPEHVGTHCDAPAHAVPELMDQTIDRFPIDQMVGPACVIDVSARNLDAGEVLTAADITAWESEHGQIRSGDIVLINFGWYKRHWRTDEQARYYVTNQPGLDEAALKLIYERGAKALGSDNTNTETPIRDGVALTPSYAHTKYFLPNGIPLIESLANLERLPPHCYFIALPLKIKGGSGSPIRPIALIPRHQV